jgi:Family of unknown function (DUF6084)
VTELAFTVLDAQPEPYAATPTLLFRVRATEASGATVHAIALRAQIHIEPQRRRYAGSEADQITDLFGTQDRWPTTLRPFLWTHTSAMVRGFSGSIEFDLPMPCTYDFEVAGSKYLHALADGEVPLVLRFAGTVFTRGGTGFGVEQVPWHLESAYRLPVRVWRDLMDAYFPGGGWIRLDRETLDALVRHRSAGGYTSWEQMFGALLPAPAEVTP